MAAVRVGAFVVLAALGLTVVHGVAAAEPSGSGASADDTSAPADDSPADDSPDDAASGAENISAEEKAELASDLAEIDREVAEVVALRQQVDSDPGFEPATTALVDAEADELVREQRLVHEIAEQQGIAAAPLPAAPPTPTLTQAPRPVTVGIDAVATELDISHAEMLTSQMEVQAAEVRAKNAKLAELNARLHSPSTPESEKVAIHIEIDRLTSSSQLEMTQLQTTNNMLNKTTADISAWLAKDRQATGSPIVGVR